MVFGLPDPALFSPDSDPTSNNGLYIYLYVFICSVIFLYFMPTYGCILLFIYIYVFYEGLGRKRIFSYPDIRPDPNFSNVDPD